MSFDSRLRVNGFNCYADFSRDACVVKLHGSINWFKQIQKPTQAWEGGKVFRPLIDGSGPALFIDDVESVGSPYPSQTHGDRVKWLYPVLTAPLAQKTDEEMACPRIQLQALKGFLASCTKLLVIGSSGRDQDLLKILGGSFANELDWDFVGGGDSQEVIDARTRFARAIPGMSDSSIHGGTFESGFRDYIYSSAFEEFLRV